MNKFSEPCFYLILFLDYSESFHAVSNLSLNLLRKKKKLRSNG